MKKLNKEIGFKLEDELEEFNNCLDGGQTNAMQFQYRNGSNINDVENSQYFVN